MAGFCPNLSSFVTSDNDMHAPAKKTFYFVLAQSLFVCFTNRPTDRQINASVSYALAIEKSQFSHPSIANGYGLFFICYLLLSLPRSHLLSFELNEPKRRHRVLHRGRSCVWGGRLVGIGSPFRSSLYTQTTDITTVKRIPMFFAALAGWSVRPSVRPHSISGQIMIETLISEPWTRLRTRRYMRRTLEGGERICSSWNPSRWINFVLLRYPKIQTRRCHEGKIRPTSTE